MSDDDVVRLMRPSDPLEFVGRFRDLCMAHPGDYWASANYALDQGLHVGDDFLQGTGIPGHQLADSQTFYRLDGPGAPYLLTIGSEGEDVVCMLHSMNTSVTSAQLDEIVSQTGPFQGEAEIISRSGGAGRIWRDAKTGRSTTIVASTDSFAGIFVSP